MRVTTKPDETAKTLVGSATVADKLRSSLVQLMATMAGAERAALDVEQKRLAAKYGPDSLQAMTAAARHQVLELERIAIDADVIRQSIPTPDTGVDRFPVYGRILTRTGDGVLRATVTAVDPSGADLGHAVTADLGVFSLQVPTKAKPPSSGIAAGAAPDAPIVFQLRVVERKSNLSFTNDEVFEAIPERMAYREIVIPEAPAPTPAPPKQTGTAASKKAPKPR